MRALLNTALIAAAAIAAPASAQYAATTFTGPRIEAHVGYDNVRVRGVGHADGVVYGLGAGYDFPVGTGGTIIGVEVNGELSSTDRDYFGFELKASATSTRWFASAPRSAPTD